MMAAHRSVFYSALIGAALTGLTITPTRADPPPSAADRGGGRSEPASDAGLSRDVAASGDVAASSDVAASGDVASRSLSQSSVFASVSQSWRGTDHDLVYGHFDLGAPPNVRRYYCLIDARSGKREPNGVLGDLIVQKDGTTAIHMDSVSLYACADAQRAGYVEMSGYKLTGRAATALASAPGAAPASPVSSATPGSAAASAPVTARPSLAATGAPAAAPPAAAPAPTPVMAIAPAPGLATPAAPLAPRSASTSREGTGRIEVGGVHLGMSVEEVRVAVKGRGLLDYWESSGPSGALVASGSAAANARFMRRIEAWSAANAAGDGESLEVLFTPAPGHERAYVIVHTVAYAPLHAVRQAALDELLVTKYGGFSAGAPLPASPTWRLQRGGRVEVGDECELRGLFGGLREIASPPTERADSTLSTPLEELQSQADRCGIAIVTEDHLSTNATAGRDARRVARFTISAYSPTIALDGLREAAQNRTAGEAHPVAAERASSPSLSDL